jgi:transcriptional regulator with XRE-family HTH domain
MKEFDLRASREKLKLTQAQLAERLGVPSNTIARWERGELNNERRPGNVAPGRRTSQL